MSGEDRSGTVFFTRGRSVRGVVAELAVRNDLSDRGT